MTGTTIAAEIAAALREVGRDTGAGELIATITRQGAATGPAWEPVYGPPDTYDVAVMDTMVRVKDAAGTLIGEPMRVLLIEAGVVVPLKGDAITIRGVQHYVDTVQTVAPGGVDLLYKVTLQR
jgi:hypothetical protein